MQSSSGELLGGFFGGRDLILNMGVTDESTPSGYVNVTSSVKAEIERQYANEPLTASAVKNKIDLSERARREASRDRIESRREEREERFDNLRYSAGTSISGRAILSQYWRTKREFDLSESMADSDQVRQFMAYETLARSMGLL